MNPQHKHPRPNYNSGSLTFAFDPDTVLSTDSSQRLHVIREAERYRVGNIPDTREDIRRAVDHPTMYEGYLSLRWADLRLSRCSAVGTRCHPYAPS